MFRSVFAAVCLIVATTLPAQADDCAADNLTRVKGGDECLVIKTFGTPGANPALIVFIHGDGSRGGPSDYLYKYAEPYGRDGNVAVGLIRPGYFDSDDNKSTGYSYRRQGDGYREHVVDAVAGAVEALKAYHGAKRVVLVGHSGGAAISGVILGRHPGLADAAVLAACPCHVPDWRWMRRGKNNWTSSLSPHEFAESVPAGTRVIALTGENDSNTKSVIARDYIESLTKRGIEARFSEIAGASHNGVARSDAFLAAIGELLN